MTGQSIGQRFFECFFAAVVDETEGLSKLGLLEQREPKEGHARAFTKVFKELTMSYVALRRLYSGGENSSLTFKTEVPVPRMGKDSIDLVLIENGQESAFEIKRWQKGEEAKKINGKDYEKLKAFMQGATGRLGYALVLTAIDHAGRTDYFSSDPIAVCQTWLKDFDAKYQLAGGPQARSFKTFTICGFLLEPRL